MLYSWDMSFDIEKILALTEFSLKFRNVKRKTYYAQDWMPENDAEHSWQLAFIGLYLIQTYNLPYNIEKVMLYAIVHDIVEIYAWDVPFLKRTHEQELEKIENEKKAFERIVAELPEWPALHSAIHDYEHRSDDEAKFIYVLDKLLPILNMTTDWGYRWKNEWHSLQDEIDAKERKNTAQSPKMHELYEQIMEYMKNQEKELF